MTDNGSRKAKVLIIGLDGATFNLMMPWMEEGELPALSKLLQKGAHGVLMSTIPPMSAQAWSSFMTGRNIGKHGLVDFLMRQPGSYGFQIVNASSREGETLWGLVSERGYRVGVLNVPMTYPPEAVNGFLVAGMDAPSLNSELTSPPSLRDELLQAVPGYVIEAGEHHLIQGKQKQPARFLQHIVDVADARLEATELLMSKGPLDLMVSVFRLTDTVQHWFWKHMDRSHPFHQPEDEALATAIKQIYQHADRCVATLLEHCDEDTYVAIVSDHGFGPAGNRVLYLNTWLQQQGLLSFEGAPGGEARRVFVHRVLWPVWRGLKRGFPTPIKRWLKAAFPRLERQVQSTLTLSGINWSNTQAYSWEVRPAIWINLKGREPGGIVEPGEPYERLRDDLVRRLLAWRDPKDNEPVVERVFKREELYHGPHLDKIPDLLLQLRLRDGYAYQLGHGTLTDRTRAIDHLSEQDFSDSLRPNGSHTLEGICIIQGPRVQGGVTLSGASLVDIAPTVLHLMGEAIPEDMDGRVLTEALDPGWLAEHPPRFVSREKQAEQRTERAPLVGSDPRDGAGYSDEEGAEVEKRLRGLGYLD